MITCHKMSQNSRIKGFLCFFCLFPERTGIRTNNYGFRWPKKTRGSGSASESETLSTTLYVLKKSWIFFPLKQVNPDPGTTERIRIPTKYPVTLMSCWMAVATEGAGGSCLKRGISRFFTSLRILSASIRTVREVMWRMSSSWIWMTACSLLVTSASQISFRAGHKCGFGVADPDPDPLVTGMDPRI
jgi:hypothetical protein